MRRTARLVAALALLALPFVAAATDLRGRIDTRNPYTNYFHPFARAEVALLDPRINAPVAVTYTGPDGFYYFYGVPPGQYVLIINRSLRVPVAIPPVPGFDIRPILY